MAFTTRRSLLAGVKAGDDIAWQDFYETYKPLVILCGKDRRLTPTEIDELVQDVMTEIFQKDIVGKFDPDHIPDGVVFHYDPARGRFRHYMRGIINNLALRIIKKRKDYVELDNLEKPIVEPLDDVWNKRFDEEWRKQIIDEALLELNSHVKPKTYQAFDLCFIQGRPVEEVASFLNMSEASVYQAKSRCIKAFREIITKLGEQ